MKKAYVLALSVYAISISFLLILKRTLSIFFSIPYAVSMFVNIIMIIGSLITLVLILNLMLKNNRQTGRDWEDDSPVT